MPGCGGNCTCGRQSGDTNKMVSEPRVSIAEALARVVVDNRVIVRAIELYKSEPMPVSDIVNQINREKEQGLL